MRSVFPFQKSVQGSSSAWTLPYAQRHCFSRTGLATWFQLWEITANNYIVYNCTGLCNFGQCKYISCVIDWCFPLNHIKALCQEIV